MSTVNYSIEKDHADYLILRDLGPWDNHMTITNAAKDVVEGVLHVLGDRRLYYYDSEGSLGELLIKDNEFNGFAPGGPKE